MARLTVAMSGGGHRACVFALGVMLYLAEADRTRTITSVSSVSGGSFANGAFAQDLDLTTCPPADLEVVVRRVARRVADKGVLFAAPFVVAYVAVLVLLMLAAIAAWFLPISGGLRLLVFIGVLVVLASVGALRGRVSARAYGQTVFTRAGSRTRLRDIHTGVDHVFCATDLHAGEHFYFSGRFVGAYRFGVGKPAELPLDVAVQASAAFPGAFPVTWVRLSQFDMQGEREEAAGTRALALVDGGVYDNMGDQWGQGLARRSSEWAKAANPKPADELVVISAAAGLAFGKAWKLRLPFAGGLFTLLRDKSVLYDNGNSVRREALVSRFNLAAKKGRGLNGALVHIEQSPFLVPNAYESADGFWPERAERARAAKAKLLAGPTDAVCWKEIAEKNALVHTMLFALSPEDTARLLYHAYVLAMVDLHVILGYPLLDLPAPERFEEMVRSP